MGKKIFAASIVVSFLLSCLPARAQTEIIRPIIYPVIGHTSFSDDFGDGRSGSRTHLGNDLMGKKGLPLVAAVDGVLRQVPYPQASWGYSISIRDKDDFTYYYYHVNNDTPGTDDGEGGGMYAYAPGVSSGNRVVAGQLIGWMGDSGNAEGTPPHLHFEIHWPEGTAMNPYISLKNAQHITAPVIPPALPGETLPYGEFMGGANVAVGNFDGDADMEFVTGAGSGGGSHVRLFEGDGATTTTNFMAYGENFRGGVDVAAGDIDADGIDEIITAAGPGGGPHVRIFKADGAEISGFYAYGEKFTGGVRVSAADLDGDGKAEIVTGAGPTGGPHIRVFTASGAPVSGFFAYDEKFTGGVDVAAVEKMGDYEASIITTPGPTGGAHVQIFNIAGQMQASFFAFEDSFKGGLRVSAGNIKKGSQSAEFVVVPASSGGAHTKLFDLTGVLLSEKMMFENWWVGSFDVAAGAGSVFVSTGKDKRRASVRPVTNWP